MDTPIISDSIDEDGLNNVIELSQYTSKQKTNKWISENHGYKKTPFWGARIERIVTLLLLLVLLCALIAWGIVVYERMRKSNKENLKQIHNLRIEFEKYKLQTKTGIDTKNKDSTKKTAVLDPAAKKQIQQPRFRFTNLLSLNNQATKKKDKDEMVVIKLIGDGQAEQSEAGRPLHKWRRKPLIKSGNISFLYGRYISIESSGLYFVYAQMFFGNNTHLSKNNDVILDFAIVKNYDRIASTSIPLAACKSSCTASLSQMIKLNKKDHLSIQTVTADQKFIMMKEKVYFGTYKIKF